jgi:hypothetical protein
VSLVGADLKARANPLREHGHVADDADQQLFCSEPLERVDHLLECLRIEGAEPFIDEDCLELRAETLTRQVADVAR